VRMLPFDASVEVFEAIDEAGVLRATVEVLGVDGEDMLKGNVLPECDVAVFTRHIYLIGEVREDNA
jgi:hypothetical protein